MLNSGDIFNTADNGNLALNNYFSNLAKWSSDNPLDILVEEFYEVAICAL